MPRIKNPEEITSTSETREMENGDVEVSLQDQDTPQPEKSVEHEEKRVQPKSNDDVTSMRNKLYAQDRIMSKLQKELEEIKSRTNTAATQKPTDSLDDLDRIAQENWKKAVGIIAENKAREIVQLSRQEEIQLKQQEYEKTLLENNVQTVLSKYPDLEDHSSEKAAIWSQILEKNPRWRTSSDGPLLVMYEMENELRKRGYDIDGNIKKNVDAEVTRTVRVASTSLPSSRTVQNTNKVVLTAEQREFCDQNGVKYEDYARNIKNIGKGGIEA